MISPTTAMGGLQRTIGPDAGLRIADASPPLAEAKLAPPRPRAGIVHRQRVMRALDAGTDAALTLVAAPPGYGKTTAVRAWCASRQAAPAWVTLDSEDNDPARLWTYVATAVDRARKGLGRATLQLEHGGWYRVHSLFADFADFELTASEPGVKREPIDVRRPGSGRAGTRSRRPSTPPPPTTTNWWRTC